jgi:hypothetical protein
VRLSPSLPDVHSTHVEPAPFIGWAEMRRLRSDASVRAERDHDVPNREVERDERLRVLLPTGDLGAHDRTGAGHLVVNGRPSSRNRSVVD